MYILFQTSFCLLLKLPMHVGVSIAKGYNMKLFVNADNITIDDILIDHGLFETDGIYNLMKSILNNFKKIEDISLQELYDISNIKLTVKVFNATKKQLEYISYETDPELSIIKLAEMTGAIPFFFKTSAASGMSPVMTR